MTGAIVVAVDGSPGSQRALAWAVAEARVRNAPLRVVRAWSYLDQPGEHFDPAYGEDDARRGIDEAIAALGDAADGVEIERVVVCDLPARAVLEAAAGAELLVIGKRGMGGFKGLMLGSVSQQVAQHAPCPVVIVPGDERPSSE